MINRLRYRVYSGNLGHPTGNLTAQRVLKFMVQTAAKRRTCSQNASKYAKFEHLTFQCVKLGVKYPILVLVNRHLPALRLGQSPLVFVLTQVRFETILAIDERIPVIQNALRLAGFINYHMRTIQIDRNEGGKFLTENIPQWEFIHESKRRSILIDRSSLTCQTTDYVGFETFLQDFRIGLELIRQEVNPQQGQRVGLRYVDVVVPKEGKALTWYVIPGLLGAPLSRFGNRLGQANESLLQSGDYRRLVARYTEAARGMAFPIDLLPVLMEFKNSPAQNDRFAILDTDHYDLSTFKFTTESVIERVADLHDVLDQVFRELVTPGALSEWK